MKQKDDDKTLQAVREIAEMLAARGGRALLVGGCVRDTLLGQEGKDYDIEVHGLSVDDIRSVLETRFPLDLVGASFGVLKVHHYDIDIALPRVENKTGAGHRGFMIETVPDLNYAEAAARRDFTINAIMMDPLTQEIIDPWHGQEDMKAGILRHISEHFGEDPLRVLRCMQFAARFEFAVAPETLTLCAELSQDELPKERLATEWEKLLLKGAKPSLGLKFLRDCGWIRYYPELEALIGCEQNPAWHPEGDVWNHTLGVVDGAATLRKGNETDDLILMVAALCHDFGKPATTCRDEHGVIRSLEHDTYGVKLAAAFMERIWNRNDLRETVLPLVETHMKPGDYVRVKVSDKAYRHLALKVGRLDLLADLATADILGIATEPELKARRLSSMQQFRERAATLAVMTEKPKPLVQGRHLIARGMKPGPAMSPVLEACFEAQLDGVFSDLEGGLRYLDEMFFKA